jgi:cytidylate kinase
MFIPLITIDGTSASGKSTLAKRIAEKLGYQCLNSGLLYRAITYLGLQDRIAQGTEADFQPILNRHQLDLRRTKHGFEILVDGQILDADLQSEEVAREVPHTAAFGSVRSVLSATVRRAAADGKVVAEGRDMGTEVFPDAKVKFYVDADLDQRARWRAAERLGRLDPSAETISIVRRQLETRDAEDRMRLLAPLRPAQDAVMVANGVRGLDAIVREMLEIIYQAGISAHKES